MRYDMEATHAKVIALGNRINVSVFFFGTYWTIEMKYCAKGDPFLNNLTGEAVNVKLARPTLIDAFCDCYECLCKALGGDPINEENGVKNATT